VKTLALRVEDDPAARLQAVRGLAGILDEVKGGTTRDSAGVAEAQV
jgi:hypothetical protein